MKNSIRVSTRFSFKGETFSPSAVIDLDSLSDSTEESPDFHHILAAISGIDTYSYAYEVMQMAALEFDQANGIACGFVTNGYFDWQGFVKQRQQSAPLEDLNQIAKDVLNIEDLDKEPQIKQALTRAYQLGKAG